MAKTMVPMLKRVGECDNRGGKTGGGGSERKTKPIKLLEAIRVSGASTK
jgi:hypothetical protein